MGNRCRLRTAICQVNSRRCGYPGLRAHNPLTSPVTQRSRRTYKCGVKQPPHFTDKDENKKRLFYTTPMHPSNISRTKKDEILLTCTDNGDRYKLAPTSRRVIQRLDLRGNVIHVYEFGADGKNKTVYNADYSCRKQKH
ncbi:hypothetical protein FSP39_021035 [Pinctada imbricata]|uniref:Uncharacterized protein n=1 Tax=Pinctada imbricata TaxID=66713 RepID=A0AA88YE67_PINIB|nr:hypothetical protein FSP39_021035 [Pinctada imbricata]